MSIIPPGITHDLQFYLSGPLPCPYLPAQVERKLFTRLGTENVSANTQTNAALCRVGFRRSHDVVYRPACNACNACIPVRIPVNLFIPSRSLRRLAKQNRDLLWERADPSPSSELFKLFTAYQAARHSDSDMARMREDDFASMLQEGRVDTQLYLLRGEQSTLMGCIITDAVGDGFSAVYSFFAPHEARRSLGSYLVLSLIGEAQRQRLPFIYLGYWVAESRKMSYKARFGPLQFLGPNGWGWLDKPQATV